MIRLLLLSILFADSLITILHAQSTPKEVAMAIGEKLIRETPFQYRLTIRKPQQTFKELEVVDFGRSIPNTKGAAAIGYTSLYAQKDQSLQLQLAHAGSCAIWLNGRKIYERSDRPLQIVYGERSLELPDSISVYLQAGLNHLFLVSSSQQDQWKVYMQMPQDNGAIRKASDNVPEIGLRRLPDVDSSVSRISNWLLLGPFAPKDTDAVLKEVLQQRFFGRMYPGMRGDVTWRLPQTDVLGDLFDVKIWGTNYHWNYHNGGVAWAMQELSRQTGKPQYATYASRFCDFHLNGKPFVTYQVETLDALQSANSLFLHTPLLDFTLAPSLPFVYRLLTEKDDFPLKQSYVRHVDSMMTYAQNVQLRMPASGHYVRTTPIRYTTWVDDMFMGIPFLIQAAQLPGNPDRSRKLLDDAADQVLAFNKQVFDEKAGLYVHARYSTDTVTLPHWSRANGWGIWATTELLQQLPKSDKRYARILASYKKHVEALAALQSGSGFWLNVLDRKDALPETSGTAIFIMSIARGIRNGWLDERKFLPVVWKGWDALQSKIDADGSVHDICMGTMCSEDVNYYLTRPMFDNDTHGIFAVLFACLEVDKLQTFVKGRTAGK